MPMVHMLHPVGGRCEGLLGGKTLPNAPPQICTSHFTGEGLRRVREMEQGRTGNKILAWAGATRIFPFPPISCLSPPWRRRHSSIPLPPVPFLPPSANPVVIYWCWWRVIPPLATLAATNSVAATLPPSGITMVGVTKCGKPRCHYHGSSPIPNHIGNQVDRPGLHTGKQDLASRASPADSGRENLWLLCLWVIGVPKTDRLGPVENKKGIMQSDKYD